jgi:hypothetical protein
VVEGHQDRALGTLGIRVGHERSGEAEHSEPIFGDAKDSVEGMTGPQMQILTLTWAPTARKPASHCRPSRTTRRSMSGTMP